MSYEKVSQAKQLVVGTKQTVKAIKAGDIQQVVIAKDADYKVVSKLLQASKDMNVEVLYVDSMKKLGKACGIDVAAATVGIMK
ncbi:ribosomal protein L7Ae-like protein [Bacillus coahuilensis m2-6]|uniref:RNA-binding protein Q75_14310 n=1 Tax=Bacillus coahuilensis p1.1.43 TaxID=1150625 RepID=A0A147K5B5_9BACI|nr:50S ribosomal protein L7ae-like protein [Bacillus coahuilensis]KUP04614.1 ribosomal protein L7Ae-like protein [Bacillus coahuilensis m2-6]KUP04796.1 ribosomal protein L7Ae-like protein [Bacillus coahuilensis p1.1.43]